MDSALLQDAKRIYAFMSEGPSLPSADFLLALGSHDLRVAEHAAFLYTSGAAPLVICSGGYGKMTAGNFAKPEAILFQERCEACGVPKQAILVEPEATNTGENFTLSKKLLFSGTAPRAGEAKTGIAVCKPYMAKRAIATARRQWPEVTWGVSVPPIPFEEYAEDLRPEIELMVGDLQRLKVYAERGFPAETPVPPDIWAAWRRLADAGFDRYVIDAGSK